MYHLSDIILGETEERGIKQKSLADRTGMKLCRVHNILNLKADPTVDETLLFFSLYNLKIQQRRFEKTKLKDQLVELQNIADNYLNNEDIGYEDYKTKLYTELTKAIEYLCEEKSVEIKALAAILNQNYINFRRSVVGTNKMKGHLLIALLLHYRYEVVNLDKEVVIDAESLEENMHSIKSFIE